MNVKIDPPTTAGCELRKSPQISRNMEILEATIGSVEDSVNQLVLRLAPISRQEPDCAADDLNENENLVELAIDIKKKHVKLSQINAVLLSALDRLEL